MSVLWKANVVSKVWFLHATSTFDVLFELNEPANPLGWMQMSRDDKISPVFCLLRDDDDEDGEKAAQRCNNRSMLSYFSAAAGGGSQSGSDQVHRFFSDRKLKSLDTLWGALPVSDAPPHRWVWGFTAAFCLNVASLDTFLCSGTKRSLKLCSYWTLLK